MTARTFFGNPCNKNHDGLRYMSNGACVHCTKAKRMADLIETREQLADEGKPRRGYQRKVARPEVRYAPEVVSKRPDGRKTGKAGLVVATGETKANRVENRANQVENAHENALDLLDDL